VINEFLNHLDKNLDVNNHSVLLDDYKHVIVYGNGIKNSKIKPYIYQEFEFYHKDPVDNGVYIEQLIIDTLSTEEFFTNELNNSLIFLETLSYYYMIFVSVTSCKTVQLSKEFNKEQLHMIISEMIDDTVRKFIFIYKYINKLDIHVLNISISKKNELNINYFEIDVNAVSAKMVSVRSLKIKENLMENKSNLLILTLSILFIFGNEFYLNKKIEENLNKNLRVTKEFLAKNKKKNKEIDDELKKLKDSSTNGSVKTVAIDKIPDFKENYQTEIKKLF